MVNKRKSCGKSTECPLLLFSIDDCPDSVPAAGWRNGTSLNNAGENGNYWSSTPNEENSNNAYNLNFNSDNHNLNWNYRNNGQSVRPVSELTNKKDVSDGDRHFSISKSQLLKDLYHAYKDARRHKRGKNCQLDFELNLESNLVALRDELIEGRYSPGFSNCFIIHDPKMREVFAAQFRDRIVHHLFYNYTHQIFERTFVYDSYSCIKNRGTHFGIERLKHHIKSVSAGFSKPCYVLKIDIKGYFMSINRDRLLQLCRETLDRAYERKRDKLVCGDHEFVDFLLEKMICFDPVCQCRIIGTESDWAKLPPEKSLFHSAPGCGLPIGNLSSQLFSNVYMNKFDQYVKRTLKCRHYGRYVDDAYIVSSDRGELKRMLPHIVKFLDTELGLTVSFSKTRIFNASYGVEFLGAYIKPFRTYVSSSSLRRITKKARRLDFCEPKRLECSVNSFLGVFSHYDSYCLRKVLFTYRLKLCRYGRFSNDILKFRPYGT